MKMQIPVTNQKTKWIRPASRVAGSGSQCRRVATRTPSAPATAAKRASWTIEPLRTCPRIYWTGRSRGVSNHRIVGSLTRPVKGGSSGTRSWHLSHRSRRDPCVRRACDDERGECPRRRLDPHGRRVRRNPALADLLVVVGGAWVLVAPADDVRGRRPSAVLGRKSER